MRFVKNTVQVNFMTGFIDQMPRTFGDQLVLLIYNGHRTGNKEIVSKQKIPFETTEKVFSDLSRYYQNGDYVTLRYLVFTNFVRRNTYNQNQQSNNHFSHGNHDQSANLRDRQAKSFRKFKDVKTSNVDSPLIILKCISIENNIQCGFNNETSVVTKASGFYHDK